MEFINNDAMLAASLQKQLDGETISISEDEEHQTVPFKMPKVKTETGKLSIKNSQGIMVRSFFVSYHEHVSINSNLF